MNKKQSELFSVKPVFVPRLTAWRSLPWAVIGTLGLTIMGGTALWLGLSLLGLGRFISAGTPYFISFIAGAAGIAPFYYELKKKTAKRSFCRFYGDYLEYEVYGFFFHRHAGRVYYRDVAGMFQRSDFLQQREHLKTIYLSVPGIGWEERGFSGLKLVDVPIGKGIGRRIEALLEMNKGGGALPSQANWVAPPAASGVKAGAASGDPQNPARVAAVGG